MIRGKNNKFYFIEQDKYGSFDTVYALVFEDPGLHGCWQWKKQRVIGLDSGGTIALELDPFTTKGYRNSKMSSKSSDSKSKDSLFLIDSQLQVKKIQESHDESQPYNIEER